ncbi:phosphoadenosine phosphosulfate reductase family protein [Methylomonas sp. MED-D]|uniref:phosphoadenosine phosphosulfate reductase family protein n=1 Tax=Methylomonas sp. MED-D TaxID=3418768 RepID=UPI003D06E3C9
MNQRSHGQRKQSDIFGLNRFGIESNPTITADLIVVPCSGGKDSQACIKLAKTTGKRVIGAFCDTKFEHPLTYSHIDRMQNLYGIKIYRINEGSSVPEQVIRHREFPGIRHRFCTKNLKIRPSKRFYESLSREAGPFEVWIGVRKDESTARAKRYSGLIGDEILCPHEFMSEYPKRLAANGVMFRLPIIDWSADDVFDYLGGEENPLYSHGAKRVGCFPCLAVSDDQMRWAFGHDEFGRNQWRTVHFLEQKIGKTALRNDTYNSCSFCNI